MNAPEAAKLLAILSAIDRREFDATTAQGWAFALDDVPYERGLQAIKQAIRAGVPYIDVQAIRAQLRTMRPRLEADVRSAKTRGLVPESWPATQPLTGELEQQLRDVQATDWAETNDRPEEISPPRPGQKPNPGLGITTRRAN